MANYSYCIRQIKGQSVLFIEGLGIGGSVITDNVHPIVDQICTIENINPVEHVIIFKDYNKKWNGYVFSSFQIISLQEDNWFSAVMTYIKLYQ